MLSQYPKPKSSSWSTQYRARYRKSQEAQKERPLYAKVTHNNWLKVAPSHGPLVFQVVLKRGPFLCFHVIVCQARPLLQQEEGKAAAAERVMLTRAPRWLFLYMGVPFCGCPDNYGPTVLGPLIFWKLPEIWPGGADKPFTCRVGLRELQVRRNRFPGLLASYVHT